MNAQHLCRPRVVGIALLLSCVMAAGCGASDDTRSVESLTARQNHRLERLGIGDVLDEDDAFVLLDRSGEPIGEVVADGSSVEVQLGDELATMRRDGMELDVECVAPESTCTHALAAAEIVATLGMDTPEASLGSVPDEAPADAAARIAWEATQLRSESPPPDASVGCIQHIDGCTDWGIYFDGLEICWNYSRCTVNVCSGVWWCVDTWG